MKRFDLTILLVGKICAGKTTLAKIISENYNIPIISFGSFVRKECKKRKLKLNRENLQKIGIELINNSPKEFIENVVKYNSNDNERIAIFEGIRHISIFNNIVSNSTRKVVIFVEANINRRFERYIEKEHLNINFEDFKKIDNHNVEIEINELKKYNDIIINTEKSIEENKEIIFSMIMYIKSR